MCTIQVMEHKDLHKNNLSIPVAIVLGCLILGGAFYLIQANKQKSIERQQEKQALQDKLEAHQSECASLSKGVMQQWNNVMGVTYDNDFWKECVVTYTDDETGEIQTSPLSSMKTIN